MESTIPYVIPLTSQKPKPLTLVPNDPGSRYKTRQLQVQVVGKSKMIKTVLVNILDVAKDMQVPPPYIGTFMGYVIGAQAKFDAKKPERQQAFLSGEHDTKDLSKIMYDFINEVVLCPNCGLPEILIVPEQKTVMGTCRACGAHSELKITDEKFKRYVINHPPTQSKGAFGGNKAGAKKDTSKAKDRNKDKEGKDDDSEEDENGEEKEAPEEEKKPAPEEKPKKSSKKSNGSKKEEADDVVWFSDTSEEAARKRREEMLPESFLTEKERKAKVDSDDVKKILKETPVADHFKALQQLKISRSIDDKTFVIFLFSGLFGSNDDLKAEVKNKRDLLSKFVTTKEAQISLLNCVENYCGKINTEQLNKVSFIIKELYDLELVDEENVLKWYETEKSYAIPTVREKAAPIIKWFQEADEEEEEEDE